MRIAARSSRWTAAAAMAVLLAQLGGIAHLAFSAHVRCEHGELVEADRAVPPPPSHAAREARVSAGRSELAVEGDHQHCLVQLHARAQVVPRAFPWSLSAPGTAVAPAQVDRPVAARNDRYRLVPKQSPPV